MTLQPGDIHYPHADPIWNDGDVVAPPWPEYVPPHDPDAPVIDNELPPEGDPGPEGE
jgi:hypothetical protein